MVSAVRIAASGKRNARANSNGVQNPVAALALRLRAVLLQGNSASRTRAHHCLTTRQASLWCTTARLATC